MNTAPSPDQHLELHRVPVHDPELEPRDEAIFLLKIAAGIEHALIVQHFFAKASLQDAATECVVLLDRILRSEFSRFTRIQNLLALIGGPLAFQRDDPHRRTGCDPMKFRLEPLTRESLANYIWVVSPEDWSRVDLADWPEFDSIACLQEHVRRTAEISNGGDQLSRTGPIFAQLVSVIRELDQKTDFPGMAALQSGHAETCDQHRIHASRQPGDVRDRAVTEIQRLAETGVGGASIACRPTRFDLLLRLFRSCLFRQPLTWPIPDNPNTTSADNSPETDAPGSGSDGLAILAEQQRASSRILNDRARLWAQLFNQRYRLFLGFLQHSILLQQETACRESTAAQGGKPAARRWLWRATRAEVRHLNQISQTLVRLPLDCAGDCMRAGPPFELPYAVEMPVANAARWRCHLDTIRAADRLAEWLQECPADRENRLLKNLISSDAKAQGVLRQHAYVKTSSAVPFSGGTRPGCSVSKQPQPIAGSSLHHSGASEVDACPVESFRLRGELLGPLVDEAT